MTTMRFNEGWQLRHEELRVGPDMGRSCAEQGGRMDVRLPCDVHVPLIGSGAIREPLEGENYKACRWIEDKSWWFRKEFRIGGPGEAFRRVELTIESLDAEADVFLNGTALGRHRSAFYPLVRDVKELLVQGANTLLVRVTSGLEHFSEQDIAGLKPYEVWHGSRDDRDAVLSRNGTFPCRRGSIISN